MQSQKLQFLLVEDDDNHAHLVLRNLATCGLHDNEVVRARDGAEALALLRAALERADTRIPDLILLDLRLPKMDGLDVLDEIKSSARLRSIPVVILTTSDAESDLERAYAAHANSYLVKPADFDAFRTMMNDIGRYWGKWNRNI